MGDGEKPKIDNAPVTAKEHRQSIRWLADLIKNEHIETDNQIVTLGNSLTTSLNVLKAKLELVELTRKMEALKKK